MLAAMAKNVVRLNNTVVYEQIQRYFDKLERRSKSTKNTYETDIRLYFKLMFDKDIEHLTLEEINSIGLDDFEDYIKLLSKAKNKKGKRIYSNATINKKITSLKGMLKYLAGKKITNPETGEKESVVKDISYFPLIESFKVVSEHYDAFTIEEVIKMSEIAATEKENGELKRLLLLFALDTAIRKSALLTLKWNHFKENDFDVEIIGVDKGNKEFTKKISKPFYNELLTIKTESPYVFPIKKATLDKMFERVRDKAGLSPDKTDKRLVFHSIRKTGGSFIYSQTKDLNITRLYLNHSKSTTTQLYIPNDNPYGAMGAISMRDSVDSELYKKTDLKILIEAIDSLDSGQQMLINKKLMEIINGK